MNPEIAIIGGGPAGIATAIQLKRFDLDPCLFEKDRLGGLLWNAQWVENYPGYYQGISGRELAKKLKNHLETFNVKVIYEPVTDVHYNPVKEAFSLTTLKGTYSAQIVVIASGTTANRGDLPDLLPRELYRNVYFEILPILNKKNKKILIIGAGDIAFDYALNLSCQNEIILLYRGNKIKALPLLGRRIRENPNVRLIDSATIEKVRKGKGKKLSVSILGKDISSTQFEIDYIVGAIGRLPQVDFLNKDMTARQGDLGTGGRLFFAGDVKNGRLRQAAIAVGNGIEVAMKIFHHLKKTNLGANYEDNLC